VAAAQRKTKLRCGGGGCTAKSLSVVVGRVDGSPAEVDLISDNRLIVAFLKPVGHKLWFHEGTSLVSQLYKEDR
jgi:hypothetical protein